MGAPHINKGFRLLRIFSRGHLLTLLNFRPRRNPIFGYLFCTCCYFIGVECRHDEIPCLVHCKSNLCNTDDLHRFISVGAIIYFQDMHFYCITYIAFYCMVWTWICIILPLNLPPSFQVCHLPYSPCSLWFTKLQSKIPFVFFLKCLFLFDLLRIFSLRNAFIVNIFCDCFVYAFLFLLQACRLGYRSFFAHRVYSIPHILGFGHRNMKYLLLV